MRDLGPAVLAVESMLHRTGLQQWRYVRTLLGKQLLLRRNRELQLGRDVLFAVRVQLHVPLRSVWRSGCNLRRLPRLLRAARMYQQQPMLLARRRDLLDGGRLLQLRRLPGMQQPG